MKRILAWAAVVLIAAATIVSCIYSDIIVGHINVLLEKLSSTEESGELELVEESGMETVEVSNMISLGITDFDTWNPLLTKSSTVKEAMELVYEPLYEINTNHEAVGVLANGYWSSADGRTVEITVKDGVKWHDGSSFDAYDVAYTVKHILNGNTNYTSLLSDVADYRALNGSVIRFVLKRSVPDFASLLTFPVVKYQSDMTGRTKAIGTGPFSLYGKVGSDKYIMVAHDMYHGGRAAMDAVYLCVAPDIEKYRLMFDAREFDLMTDSVIDLVDGMPNGNLTVYDYVSDRMTYIGLNTEASVLKGEATRRGLAYLIDKDAIISKLLYSRAVPADIAINPSSYLNYDISRSYGIEYENAYDEFEKDGWEGQDYGFIRETDGDEQELEIVLLVNADNEQKVRIAEYIEADMERYGVSVVLDKEPFEVYRAKIEAHNYDAFLGETELRANGDLTPLTGEGNCFGYSSARVNTLISQSGMTKDIETRKQLFISLGQEIEKDAPFIPVYFSKGCVIAGTKLKNPIEPSVSADYRNSHIWRVK